MLQPAVAENAPPLSAGAVSAGDTRKRRPQGCRPEGSSALRGSHRGTAPASACAPSRVPDAGHSGGGDCSSLLWSRCCFQGLRVGSSLPSATALGFLRCFGKLVAVGSNLPFPAALTAVLTPLGWGSTHRCHPGHAELLLTTPASTPHPGATCILFLWQRENVLGTSRNIQR